MKIRLSMPYTLRSLRSQKFISIVMLLCMILSTVLCLYLDTILLKASQQLESLHFLEVKSPVNPLDFIEQIYVLSLPERRSRREAMEKLRLALGLNWSYVDAFPADVPLVERIMNLVSFVRDNYSMFFKSEHRNTSEFLNNRTVSLFWPKNIDELAISFQGLDIWSSDLNISKVPFGNSSITPSPPLACATKDYRIATLSSALPEHLVLTPARVACWHSHLYVIHKIANSLKSDNPGAALILEDDVDMEKDIVKQLRSLWPLLPPRWDIIFLGHCWSDERKGRLLMQNTSIEVPPYPQLYTSSSPKCTHAYALSRIGARRLLLHLRYPPFAYSRAIDQAFSWLIESRRLNSFSIVPSLVVQRKIEKSDVVPGFGSKWKDRLINGIFG
ncbi:hypothetical protein CPB84DRAFT_1822468 [Gymnopilus junonius]|uniref:Glycosyltransferase family 25 protein n=1 Tax=Gymnopilus junonius TaxID=109634 RepID=A0A9P5NVE4_GYMJU|nr:hypothetical protein CPB84DRAFT_1822468 [Gymnopilus junonius]